MNTQLSFNVPFAPAQQYPRAYVNYLPIHIYHILYGSLFARLANVFRLSGRPGRWLSGCLGSWSLESRERPGYRAAPAFGAGLPGGDISRPAVLVDKVPVVQQLGDLPHQLVVAVVVRGGDSPAFRPYTHDARHLSAGHSRWCRCWPASVRSHGSYGASS